MFKYNKKATKSMTSEEAFSIISSLLTQFPDDITFELEQSEESMTAGLGGSIFKASAIKQLSMDTTIDGYGFKNKKETIIYTNAKNASVSIHLRNGKTGRLDIISDFNKMEDLDNIYKEIIVTNSDGGYTSYPSRAGFVEKVVTNG